AMPGRLGGERARVRVQVCSQRRVGEGRQGAANANASWKTRALGKLRCAQAPAWSLGISPKGLGADQSVREGCGLGVTLFDCGPHLARARSEPRQMEAYIAIGHAPPLRRAAQTRSPDPASCPSIAEVGRDHTLGAHHATGFAAAAQVA